MKKPKVRSFSVTPADEGGGYSVETHMKDGDKGEYMRPTTTIHTNLSSVHKHMKSHLQDDGSPKNNKSSHATISKSIVQNAAKRR
jgi:hypothetical protein